MAKFEDAIKYLIDHEVLKKADGSIISFTNDPNDPGGATNWGITLVSLVAAGWDIDHDGDVDVDDVKALTEPKAEEYYRKFWWNRFRFGEIVSQEVANKVFDTAVNMGARFAIKFLQQAVNMLGFSIAVDGGVGLVTLRTVNACDPLEVLRHFREFQKERYLQLIAKNSKLAKYRNGWLKRAMV